MAARSSRSSDRERLTGSLFAPRSIAVIGASSHPEKVGYAVLSNIIRSGYPGRIYPVNPKGGEIQGLSSFQDVGSVPDKVDLALIITPAAAVPGVVSQCVESGIPSGIIISAGFREVGIEGRRLEREMVDRARDGGMRLLGPNCLGVMNTALPLNASFSRLMPPPGAIGVISQSGAMCTSLIDWARDIGVGFSKLISLGNGADLVESDFIDSLSRDDETRVISIYMEGVSEGSRFLDSLKSASHRKPVVILKAGTTEAGAQAASSHTGALAGSERAFLAACEQSMALRAGSIEELVDLSASLAAQPSPRSPSLAVVTNAGGPGIMASDACEKAGLVLAGFDRSTVERLRKGLPQAASCNNPVDVLGDSGADRYAHSLEAVLADPHVDAVLVILSPQAMTDVGGTAEAVVRMAGESEKTVICSFMGAESVAAAVDRLEEASIPNIPYPDRAVKVLGRMFEREKNLRLPPSRPMEFRVDRKRVEGLFADYADRSEKQVGPEDCREVLDAYGIDHAPFRVAETSQEAKEIAGEMGYPVALKIVSPQILHKTDIGGVVLGIRGPGELQDAFDEVIFRVRRHMPAAEIEGVGIQKMAPSGRELILGVVRDPQFGPMVMVGMGGIYVEAFEDVAFRIAPITALEAAEMLRGLRAFRLLLGVRGEPRADIEKVEEVLIRASQMAVNHPQITEMDMNPLMVYNAGDGCICVDVRITLGGEQP